MVATLCSFGRGLPCRRLRRRRLLASFLRLGPELLGEALHTAFGIDQLLPAREKRVAVGADFEMQLGLGRSGLPRGAACAPRVDLVILRMNAFFHDGTPFSKRPL